MSKVNADTVAERRLRPIYDWLDNGNNKKAIQEADKVLKKQPELLCAQVLKGLALLRLGKNKDCEDILENVHRKMPADDCTLQAMTICYREIHQLEKICNVYEKAMLKDPFNEELNTHLFMAYVRIGDYKKQQQVALNLYKIKPKNPYYFWGVMSILMQAQTSDENISQKVMLPLAERMVEKFINEGKIEAEQEIQLYIMVLEMQKKYQEALNVIDSELGQKILSHYALPRKRIKLLQLLEKWRELNVYMKKIILEQPDSFHNYRVYFDSVFELISYKEERMAAVKQNSDNLEPQIRYSSFNGELLKPDESIEMCVNFVHKCQKNEMSSYKLRGPYLAMLLLYKKLDILDYDPVKYLGNVFDLFEKYFQLFADKACCFKDLHQFLPMVQNNHLSLLSSLWISIEERNNGGINNKKQMMMYLTYFQISRFFGICEALSINEKLTQISKLMNFYHDGHQFDANLTSTELKCSDTFTILAAHSFYDLYLDTNDLKFIKDVICLLEYAYDYSPSNHHFKLLLLKFYNLLGASKSAYKYFQMLEIKHMQYDSLGYLECWSLLYSGQYTLAIHLLDSTLKFFTMNLKEAADQLTHAYKYGSFEKVNEFLNFKEKLSNSFHYSLVCVEHAIHQLIHTVSHYSTVQAVASVEPTIANLEALSNDNFAHLVDNRDTCLFLNFDPDIRRMNEKFTKLSFEHEVMLIRLRTLILRCIEFSVNISSTNVMSENLFGKSNGVNDDSNSKYLYKFKSTIEELRKIYGLISNSAIEEIPKNVLSGVESSRLFLYSKSFFMPLFIDTVLFVHEFYNQLLADGSAEWQLQQMADSCGTTLRKIIVESIEKLTEIRKDPNEVKYRELLQHLSLVVEMVCVTSVMCGNLHSLLVTTNKNTTPSRKKKKRGKEAQSALTPTIENEDKNNKSKHKHVVPESVRKIVDDYLGTVKSSIETLGSTLLNSVSCESGFQIGWWHTQDDFEVNYTLGITNEKWFHLQSNVDNSLEESYRSSIKEFSVVIAHKLEYLSLLTL